MDKSIGKVDVEYVRELGALVFRCPRCREWHIAYQIKLKGKFIDVTLIPCNPETDKTAPCLTLRKDQFDTFLESRGLIWTPLGIAEVKHVGG